MILFYSDEDVTNPDVLIWTSIEHCVVQVRKWRYAIADTGVIAGIIFILEEYCYGQSLLWVGNIIPDGITCRGQCGAEGIFVFT